MTTRRQTIILEHPSFYRRAFYWLLVSALLLITLDCLLLGWMVYCKLTEPAPIYFATTTDGRLIEVYPENPS